MTGPTHIGIGFAGMLGLCRLLGVAPSAAMFFWVLLGSLAPDIDSGNATISRPGTMLQHFLPRFLRRLLNAFGLTFSKAISYSVGHRGPLHYPVWPLSMLCFSIWYPYFFLFWFAWGYLLHLFADMFTSAGIPLLGPLSRSRFRFSRIRTGSFFEGALCILVWIAALYLAHGYLPEDWQLDGQWWGTSTGRSR